MEKEIYAPVIAQADNSVAFFLMDAFSCIGFLVITAESPCISLP
jgi:hypothetical protein